MRNLSQLDQYRVNHPLGGMGTDKSGAFAIPLQGTRQVFNIIASSGLGWDHVSVSTPDRCPRWNEMQQIKELFFEDHEVVMQLHPAKSNHINVHPYCLHLWRPHHQDIPLPDMEMV